MEIFHETLVFDKKLNATPDRVFGAYLDPKARAAWSAPSPETVIVIDSTDVRTGGKETARCGTKDALTWTMNVTYHLVEKNRLILFSEELWDGARLLTLALITFDIRADGAHGTQLILTDQITSFVGTGGVDGHRDGYTKALANLAASLSGERP